MKRFISLLLAYVMALTLMQMATVPVFAESSTTKVAATATTTSATTMAAKSAVVTSTSATATSTVKATGDVLTAAKNAGISGANVKMLIWWTASDEDKQKRDVFNAATGAKVAYETAAMNEYQTRLSAAVMSRNVPSTAAIINEWYPQPITRRLMQPLSNVSGWNFKDNNIYAQSLMDQFGYMGEHYGIALKGSNTITFEVMFFNKSILSKSGVKIGKDDPYTLWKAGKWNWDTCLEIAKKCTKNGISGLTLVNQNAWMLSAGEDFVKSNKTGLRNNVNSAGVLNAWSWNWNLIYQHKVVDTSYTGQTPFYQGKAAMLGAGSYMMQANGSRYVPQNMKDSWGVVPFPSPKGKTVAACEGTVWGFPRGVTGKTLQAAAWYLRYYLDDYNYSARDLYPQEDCWEVMKWMWDQQIQSYNSVGILTYGGEYSAYTIQYSLIDEADTKAKMKANLEQWESVFTSNIMKIMAGSGGYESNCDGNHEYSNNCDEFCDYCGYMRTTVSHTYKAATCTEPKICVECGAASDSALGTHTYKAATCTSPKTCKVCGATSGSKLGHKYSNSCDKSCNRSGCSYTRSISHSYKAATCTTPKTCKTCGATSGSKRGHTYSSACDASCNRSGCSYTRKAPHIYFDDCDIDCNRCGKVRKVTHKYSSACDSTCNVCDEYRKVSGHKYTNSCDRDCNVCGARRTVTHKYSNACDSTCNLCKSQRKVSAHVYKTAVGKAATTSANGYKIKTCTACGKTTGSKTTINKIASVKLTKTSYTYDGKVKKPGVIVKDSKGKVISSSNYTVKYATGRKNVGTYKVTITFKGAYKGTKVLTFKINPVKTTISKVTGATKALTVTWAKKTTQVTGYEIQYSTSKSFSSYKTKTVSKNSTTSLKLTGLSAKKTYYVRVRTYKTVNGVKIYSGWTAVKSIKTK